MKIEYLDSAKRLSADRDRAHELLAKIEKAAGFKITMVGQHRSEDVTIEDKIIREAVIAAVQDNIATIESELLRMGVVLD